MSGADFAVVIAAGRSQRMGTDKARLNWIDGRTLLDWTVASLQAADWLPIVVVGLHNMPVQAPGERFERLVCTPSDDDRKTTSIARGVAAVPRAARHILMVSVDQPRPIELYRALRTALHNNPAPIVVPDKHGRNGHPVAVKTELRSRLLTLEDEKLGLRGLLQEFAGQIHRMPCDPEWLVWNCNTPSDYQTAKAWFEARRAKEILERKTATNSHPAG